MLSSRLVGFVTDCSLEIYLLARTAKCELHNKRNTRWRTIGHHLNGLEATALIWHSLARPVKSQHTAFDLCGQNCTALPKYSGIQTNFSSSCQISEGRLWNPTLGERKAPVRVVVFLQVQKCHPFNPSRTCQLYCWAPVFRCWRLDNYLARKSSVRASCTDLLHENKGEIMANNCHMEACTHFWPRSYLSKDERDWRVSLRTITPY